MGRRLRAARAWTAPRNDARAHLILLINGGVAGGVALIAGAAATIGWQLDPGWGVAIALVALVGLTSCLLSPRTAMIASLLGSSLVGVVAGFIAWVAVAGPALSQLAACLGGAAGFASTFFVYRRFVLATTGAGDLEGRFEGTFNARDEQLRKASGVATVVVSAAGEGQDDDDLRVSGLTVGGAAVELLGKRREGETIADLRIGATPAAPFTLLRGKVSIHAATLIVDLEGSPFGSYVFTGQRRRD